MNGRGRALDNVFVERLWRTLKYEDIYLRGYDSPAALERGLIRYIDFYSEERPHNALDQHPRLRSPGPICRKHNADGEAAGLYNLKDGVHLNAMNPILAAAGFNIRWLMRWLAVFWRWVLSAALRLLSQRGSDAWSDLTSAIAQWNLEGRLIALG